MASRAYTYLPPMIIELSKGALAGMNIMQSIQVHPIRQQANHHAKTKAVAFDHHVPSMLASPTFLSGLTDVNGEEQVLLHLHVCMHAAGPFFLTHATSSHRPQHTHFPHV
jgi:hypothetical protein